MFETFPKPNPSTSPVYTSTLEKSFLRLDFESLVHPKPIKTSSPNVLVQTKTRKPESKNEASAPNTPEVRATLELQGIMMHHFGLGDQDFDFFEPHLLVASPISRGMDNFSPPLRSDNPLNLDRCFGGSAQKLGAELGIFRFSPELYH
jgi:hypothetical protein